MDGDGRHGHRIRPLSGEPYAQGPWAFIIHHPVSKAGLGARTQYGTALPSWQGSTAHSR